MDRWDVFATKDWVCATLLLVNAWQYAPPVDPVGSDGGISDPLRFVPPAAAEEVYLVTELGNVFPVDDGSKNANTIIIQDSDNATKDTIAGINTFLMSANAKIGGIQYDTGLEIVAGNGAKGQTYSFEPHFAIPSDIATHNDGYVSIFHDIENYEYPITIRNFFNEYRYDKNQHRLVDITPYGTVPDADFVSLLSPRISRSTAGTIQQLGNGFGVSEPGTYAIKLLPETTYWLDYGGDCVGNDCDSISVISTDSNLLGTTPAGLQIISSALFGLTQDTTVYPSQYWWDANVHLKAYTQTPNVQISDASNIRSTPSVTFSMDEEAWCKMSRSSPSYTYQYREIGNHTFGSNSFTPSTETTDGRTFINNIYATSTAELYWWNGRLGSQISMYCRADADHLPRVADFHSSSRVTVYDVGVPVRSHTAYWSHNATESMYDIGTSTKHDPSVVVVSNNDTYMIVKKTTPNWNWVDIGASYINKTGGLRITDLPPNTAYQIKDNYGLVISGSTDDNGIISIPYEPGLFRIAGDMSLNILQDTAIFNEMSGMNVYDIKNRVGMHVPESVFDGVVYSTTQYLKLPLVFDTVVQDVELKDVDCTGDGLSLSYIAGSYTVQDKHIWIPVIPGFDVICVTINNSEAALRYEDFLPLSTSVDAEQSRHSVSTAPNFNFNTRGYNANSGETRIPISGVAGNPMENSLVAASNSQFVVTTSGEMSITVSGNANADISTHAIREYSDGSLTGSFADIEDSTVSVTLNVYKNGNLASSMHLGTYTSSSLEINTRTGSLPKDDDDGRSEWYSYYKPGANRKARINPDPAPTLEMPKYYCDKTGGHIPFSHKISYRYYSCVYKNVSASQSFCELKMSYDINGNFENSGISFEVDHGDVIEYTIAAKLHANHNGFDCGNGHTATYGNTNLSLDMLNVSFEHNTVQN